MVENKYVCSCKYIKICSSGYVKYSLDFELQVDLATGRSCLFRRASAQVLWPPLGQKE